MFLLGAAAAPNPARAQPKPDECRSSQLKVTRPDWEDCCGLSHYGTVVQVTNSAEQPCQLTGAPRLRLLDASGHPVNIAVCPSCTDYTFQAKPAKPVILHRGGSAYFLLGFTVDDPDRPCGKVASFDVLSADGRPLRIELNKDAAQMAPVCDFNVTAWRKGPHQTDANY